MSNQQIVQSENISTQIYVECYKMYQSKVCVQDFGYFVPGLDIQPEQSENDNSSLKKQVAGCKAGQHIFTVFFCKLTQTHGLVIKVSRSELGALVQFQLGAETFCSP